MTASEFAFLAMGLILGVAAGAALVEVIRARPPAPREVRLTMASDAVPRRRSATLAEDGFAVAHAEPARGGPADRREVATTRRPADVERRTDVRSSSPPIAKASRMSAAPPAPPAMRLAAAGSSTAIAIPVVGGIDPLFSALRARNSTEQRAPEAVASQRAQEGFRATSGHVHQRPRSAAVLDRPQPRGQAPAGADDAHGHGEAFIPEAADPADGGPCGDVRRVALERCELATRARARATEAEDALRTAQRAYDDHEALAEAAQAAVDPRAVRRAKDEAQARFREGRTRAGTTEAVEAAARAWLAEVNAINAAAREAAAALVRERAAAEEQGSRLERLSLEADAARISAEGAEVACMSARQAVADCDEQASSQPAIPDLPAGGHQPGGPFPASSGDPDDPDLVAALSGGGTPRIFRLVRGDRTALEEVVAALSADQPEDRRRWQLAIAELVDAIVADAIEAATLDFPEEHGFWGPFTKSQDRDIVRALASLGYRFDGLGGWVDGREPSQRDLSLALGYAGLDPMRIRHWPTGAEMHELFAEVAVAADEHLAGAAGDLTLGELVSMLGRRADPLADLWNHWGRVRPLLLQAA